jgi:hypothetical protein
MQPRELYTDTKEIRLPKEPANNPGTNIIIMLGDKRNKFNGEDVDIINQTIDEDDPTRIVATATITKTKMLKFKKLVAADIVNYWDTDIDTLDKLKFYMKGRYSSAFSIDSMVTVVKFVIDE